ncbi:zinc finger, CCHC-type containing protein, partial [Tanacetum coccineum]
SLSMAEGAIFVVDVNKGLNEEVKFVAEAASRKLNVVVLLNRVDKFDGDSWGRFMIGKITSGVLAHNQKVNVLRLDIVKSIEKIHETSRPIRVGYEPR